MSPPTQDILAVKVARADGIVGRGLLIVPGVTVRLQRDRIVAGGQPVQPESALAHSPVVRRLGAIWKQSAVAVKVLSIDSKKEIRSPASSVAPGRKILKKSAPAS